MIKLILTATILLISGIAFADVPNTFQAGEAIKASEMNENFTSIDSKVDALDSRTQNVSELETKVANLEGQVETLQLLVNSVAETASTDVEFVWALRPRCYLWGCSVFKVGSDQCCAQLFTLGVIGMYYSRGPSDTSVNWSSFYRSR